MLFFAFATIRPSRLSLLSACGLSFVGLPLRCSFSAPATDGAVALSNSVIADLVFLISGVSSLSSPLSGLFGVSPADESSISGLGFLGVVKSVFLKGVGGSGLAGDEN